MYGIQYTKDDKGEISGVKITHKAHLIDIPIELSIDEIIKNTAIEKAIILDKAIQDRISLASEVDQKTRDFNLAWANAFESIFGSLYAKLNDISVFPASGFVVNLDKALEGKVKVEILGVPSKYVQDVVKIVKDNFKICKKEGE